MKWFCFNVCKVCLPGRRLIMYVSMVISMVSMLASAGSPSYALYVICRLVAGIGCGGQGTASFVLVSELVGPSIRGKHSFFAQVQFVGMSPSHIYHSSCLFYRENHR